MDLVHIIGSRTCHQIHIGYLLACFVSLIPQDLSIATQTYHLYPTVFPWHTRQLFLTMLCSKESSTMPQDQLDQATHHLFMLQYLVTIHRLPFLHLAKSFKFSSSLSSSMDKKPHFGLLTCVGLSHMMILVRKSGATSEFSFFLLVLQTDNKSVPLWMFGCGR